MNTTISKRLPFLLLLQLILFLCACSKDENSEMKEIIPPENQNNSLAPAKLVPGDRLYELILDSDKIKNYIDILSDEKAQYGSATVPSNYSYQKLTDSTSYFSFTIQINTNLYQESYIRWWKYTGELTWQSKTRCKGKFVCEFTSTKHPSSTSKETIYYEYKANENNIPDPGGNENNSKEFILAQIKALEAKKAAAEKQLSVYLEWESNATTIALITIQRELINTYERQINQWKAKLNKL